MKGFIVVYNSSSRNEITKINYFLFGRVVTIKENNKPKKYYYPGFFEDTPYKKLANGCYFVEQINDDLGGLLKIIPAEISFSDNEMLHAREFWKKRINEEVNNW